MKITRHKKVHKYINFFCNNYGFRQPFQILLDGTLCYAALKNKMNLKEQLPKYLAGEVKLLTTQCVILETEKLGPNLYGAMIIIKQFPVHKCGHEGKPVSASACIESMLGPKNASRYIVASQDRELQKLARRIPGTPLLYLHQKTPTLEQPSESSLRMAKLRSQEIFSVSKVDEKVLNVLKKRKLDEGEDYVPKKKKKKGGPNPLSCKKKKKPVTSTAEDQVKEGTAKRKRKKQKIPKHIKLLLTQQTTKSDTQ